jgi:hypothetical protein
VKRAKRATRAVTNRRLADRAAPAVAMLVAEFVVLAVVVVRCSPSCTKRPAPSSRWSPITAAAALATSRAEISGYGTTGSTGVLAVAARRARTRAARRAQRRRRPRRNLVAGSERIEEPSGEVRRDPGPE